MIGCWLIRGNHSPAELLCYNSNCSQLPEDEEDIPPILQYNNHMQNKDV